MHQGSQSLHLYRQNHPLDLLEDQKEVDRQGGSQQEVDRRVIVSRQGDPRVLESIEIGTGIVTETEKNHHEAKEARMVRKSREEVIENHPHARK